MDTLLRTAICGLLAVISGWHGAVLAEITILNTTAVLSTSTDPIAPIPGERLSDWLLRQPANIQAYPLGLSWHVLAEEDVQADTKAALQAQLHAPSRVSRTAKAGLAKLIGSLPITGRIVLPNTDARWLQAHPGQDPILEAGQRVVLPNRPVTVTVITSDGRRCSLTHQPGVKARSYLQACELMRLYQVDRAWVVQSRPGTATILTGNGKRCTITSKLSVQVAAYIDACNSTGIDQIDSAWVIQPDGAVSSVGIASWNAQAQDELAPGALLWAPERSGDWQPEFSEQFAQFLATQSYEAVLNAPALPLVEQLPSTFVSDPWLDAQVTANDWGLIGLLQTPTARMAPAGEMRFSYSHVYPYSRYNVLLQPLDWLEGGFRYTNVLNRLYGSAALSGTQTFKDKSIDIKIRLLEENARWPQVAVGITDLGGTGLFSSEYVVANKRFGDFDWSLGIGWGNLGSSGNIANPFKFVSDRFDTRVMSGGSGGTVSTGSFFAGNSALFGGLQYQTPLDKWLLKVEYDGNSYQSEALLNNQTQRTPINLGVVYRYASGIDVTAGVERGNKLMLGFTFYNGLNKLYAPKLSDPLPPVVSRIRPRELPLWGATAADVSTMTGWGVSHIAIEDSLLKLVIEGAAGAYWNDRLERMVAVLHRDAPSVINEFHVVFAEKGMPMTQRIIQRDEWVTQQLQLPAKSTSARSTRSVQPDSQLPSESVWSNTGPPFGYSIFPSWQQNLGGPDGFLLFRAGVSVGVGIKLAERTAITGYASLGLLDNYDKFKYDGPSLMPRVRTYLRQYMTTSGVTIPNLQITHIGNVNTNNYYSVYGGYLDGMFGGVGAEWLYRPWGSPVALGIDVNRVQQRSFDQQFGFKNAGTQTGYKVTTGHAALYWDTPWKSTSVKLNVGRYLAGDIGATVDVSRTFDNGVSIGAWGTKTNVSSTKFGEGSFDKGIYVRIPFDALTTSRSPGVTNLVYAPLTRDGGARLSRGVALYNVTKARSKEQTGYFPADVERPK